MLEAGRAEEASTQFSGLLAAHPNHPEILRLAAGIQALKGNYLQAIATMRQALEGRPDDALYWNTLGSLLGSAGALDDAIEALKRACELDPRLAVAWYNLGVMQTRTVRHADAVQALRHAIALEPGHVLARCLLADMLRVEGDSAAAQTEYRNVLTTKPWCGQAWWGLADLKTAVFQSGDVEQMSAAERDPRASDDDRIATGFALSRALDARNEFAAALDALARAHALARRRQVWDGSAFSTYVNSILTAFATPPVGATDPKLGHEVIFVVGMPRSGTTLVEQILASHPEVEGGGELPDLPQVLHETSHRRGQPFPQWVHAVSAKDWTRMGQRYLQRTARWRLTRPRHVDKLPINWLHVGAIRAMLPGARVVVCRRAPLETCFSCYRQLMQHNEYTRTFPDLAAYWHDFDLAARHFEALHSANTHDFEHEALLATPETAIRELLAFCGLPFAESCLNFHTTRRQVHSPSANQVRQPLFPNTTRAAAYGTLLNPLRSALGLVPAEHA